MTCILEPGVVQWAVAIALYKGKYSMGGSTTVDSAGPVAIVGVKGIEVGRTVESFEGFHLQLAVT